MRSCLTYAFPSLIQMGWEPPAISWGDPSKIKVSLHHSCSWRNTNNVPHETWKHLVRHGRSARPKASPWIGVMTQGYHLTHQILHVLAIKSNCLNISKPNPLGRPHALPVRTQSETRTQNCFVLTSNQWNTMNLFLNGYTGPAIPNFVFWSSMSGSPQRRRAAPRRCNWCADENGIGGSWRLRDRFLGHSSWARLVETCWNNNVTTTWQPVPPYQTRNT